MTSYEKRDFLKHRLPGAMKKAERYKMLRPDFVDAVFSAYQKRGDRGALKLLALKHRKQIKQEKSFFDGINKFYNM